MRIIFPFRTLMIIEFTPWSEPGRLPVLRIQAGINSGSMELVLVLGDRGSHLALPAGMGLVTQARILTSWPSSESTQSNQQFYWNSAQHMVSPFQRQSTRVWHQPRATERVSLPWNTTPKAGSATCCRETWVRSLPDGIKPFLFNRQKTNYWNICGYC